jgi:uncharacterized protein (DUF2062 family)
MRKWFKRMSPDRDKLLGIRMLRPIAHRLADPTIWHFNRHAVARGMALGLFVAFILPVGQIIVAAFFAGLARGNVLVASAATFVATPLTFPAIYYGAYKLGTWLLGGTRHVTFDHVESASSMTDMFAGASVPTLLGLLLFAIISAIIGYFGVELAWRIALIRQWRMRSRKISAQGAKQG